MKLRSFKLHRDYSNSLTSSWSRISRTVSKVKKRKKKVVVVFLPSLITSDIRVVPQGKQAYVQLQVLYCSVNINLTSDENMNASVEIKSLTVLTGLNVRLPKSDVTSDTTGEAQL